MIKKCLACEKEFITYPCKIKIGKGKYCSKKCYNITNNGGFKRGNIPYNKGKKLPPHSKEWCKKISLSHIGMKHTKETKKKLSLIGTTKTGNKSNRWTGGKRMTNGYWDIYSPNHPRAMKSKYVRCSRLVMEKHIGRYLLPKEVVHHINGIKTDDRIKNLMLFANQSLHRQYHVTNRKTHCGH